MVDNNQLQEALFEFLKKVNNSEFNYNAVIHGIAYFLVKHKIIPNQNLTLDNVKWEIKDYKTENIFNDGLLKRKNIDAILWNFINSGIITKRFHNTRYNIMTGNPDIVDNFRVTQWGLNVLSGIKPSPYDYEGYLVNIKKVINNLDETVVFYLEQSLQCFNRCLYIPSAVMLGVAAEKMILIISDIAIQKLTNKDKYLKTLKDNRYQISGHKKAIDKFVLTKMPNELSRNLEKELNCFFELIRLSRNEAGHPSEIRIDRDEAYGNYIIFRKFCKKAYELKEWLEKQESI